MSELCLTHSKKKKLKFQPYNIKIYVILDLHDILFSKHANVACCLAICNTP